MRRPLATVLAAMILACPNPILGQAPAPAAGDSPQSAGGVTDYRPKKYSPLRYSETVGNNPFEREILPPAAPEPKEGPPPFDFRLVSVSGKGESYRITLIDKKGKYKAITSKPDADGYYYAKVEPDPNIQHFRVEVANGNQTEWVEFDTKRFSVASKAATPKKPSNTKGRPNVVPNTRVRPPPRARIPPSAATKAASQKSGQAAIDVINKANAAAVKSSQEKSRSGGRRVVLPPKNR